MNRGFLQSDLQILRTTERRVCVPGMGWGIEPATESWLGRLERVPEAPHVPLYDTEYSEQVKASWQRMM